jgi:hypothetical protein
MGVAAAILGLIGGLFAVVGVLTAIEVAPLVMPELTWMFWFVLSALFLLGSIAFAVGRGEYE